MRIILFDLDCLRPDHLSCYGYDRPTSPNIDRLAADGMRFTRYYCADSPCLPSRAGLASGRLGIHNGVVSNVGAGSRFRLRHRPYGGPEPAEQMLMRQLRAQGYDTISFSNFADRHSAYWFMCGWSEFHTPNLKCGSETAEEVNEPLMRWLEHNATRDNYLLHINYWDIHRIYKMDPSWADRFAHHPVPQAWPDEEAIARHQDITGPFTATGQFREGVEPPPLMPRSVGSRSDFEKMVTGYDAAIAYTDHHVGLVLEELDRQGVLDDAVVIFTADHGDAFGEHGIYSDHVCADECIHRIPLIVRWPGRTPANGECDALLYNVDWSATLCELLGAPVPERWDGISFAPQVGGAPDGGREYLVWDHGLYTVQRAVRTRRHLLVRTYDNHGYRFEPVELYDMEADPYQTRDLASEDPELVAQLLGQMDRWVEEERGRDGWRSDPLMDILHERAG
ncbi:sulfatase [Candidatus Latescibacterota bacterium]